MNEIWIAPLLVLAVTTHTLAQDRSEGPTKSQNWFYGHKPTEMGDYERWHAWTDGYVLSGNTRTWTRMWVSCTTDTKEHFVSQDPMWQAWERRKGAPIPTIEIYTGESLTLPFSTAYTQTADGDYTLQKLRVRFDDRPPQALGFEFTRNAQGLPYAVIHPSTLGVNMALKEKYRAQIEELSAKENVEIERLIDWLERSSEETKEIEGAETITLEDLERHRRMRLEVALMPEDKLGIEGIFYGWNTEFPPGSETVVFEYSLMGSTKAIAWVASNCRKAFKDATGMDIDPDIDPMTGLPKTGAGE